MEQLHEDKKSIFIKCIHITRRDEKLLKKEEGRREKWRRDERAKELNII